MTELAEQLIQAIEDQRDEINASPIARGESGAVVIHINPAMRRVDVQVLVRDRRAA